MFFMDEGIGGGPAKVHGFPRALSLVQGMLHYALSIVLLSESDRAPGVQLTT